MRDSYSAVIVDCRSPCREILIHPPGFLASLRSSTAERSLPALLLLYLLLFAGCKRGSSKHAEMMYVSVPQANVRDRISAVYNKVATVSAGDAVEVIEKQKRFIHIKTSDGKDGWIEERYLIDQGVFDGFEKLKKDNLKTPCRRMERRARS